jgi:hypothetical protein
MAHIGEAGRYDEQAIVALDETGADVIVLIVVNGKHGHGLSVSSNDSGGEALIKSGILSRMLHAIADDIATAEPTGVRVDPVPKH